jgi:hypothetical protein
MQSRSTRSLLGALLVGALFLAACGDDDTSTEASDTTAAGGTATTVAPGGPGAVAAANYTTDLSADCPSKLVAQISWLAEPEFAAVFQLIGGGGEMAQNSYTGPLGSTGIDLQILDGGPGVGFVPIPTSLHAGNLVAGVTPDIGLYGMGDSIAQSGKFPTTAVLHTFQKDPQNLVFDGDEYSIASLDDLVAATQDGAQIYVTGKYIGYVQYLLGKGVPDGAFIEGFAGDYDRFITAGGSLINQGYSTDTNFRLEEEFTEYGKAVDDIYIADLGYDAYPISVFVATPRLGELSPCLEKLVPLMQQAMVDYVADPTEVNELLAEYNDEGYGATFWQTSVEHNQASHDVMLSDDLVSNGEDGTLGNDEVGKTEALIELLLPILEAQNSDTHDPGVTADDVFTDKFIDPSIGLP